MTFRTTLAAALLLVPVVATADPAASNPYSFGARVGGYGFRREVGDSSGEWNECRMNGMGVFGQRALGDHLFLEGGFDVYFSQDFPTQPTEGDLPIDRMSGLITAAAGMRASATNRISGYAQLGGGLELTQVSVPYDDHRISDRLAMPMGFVGIGGDIRIGAKTYLGANFRAELMGNFDYDPAKLEMQGGWTTPPSADEVFDPSPDLAAQGQFYLRRDL